MIATRVVVARTLSVLAAASILTVVLFGWWILAVAVLLALVGVLINPRPVTHGHEPRIRQFVIAGQRMLNRHLWRPRGW